ncbi:MAG: hypothetical protein ACR2KP_05645 [Egibacteraceae bacterium]
MALAALSGLLAACGGDPAENAAPGSVAKPLVSSHDEQATKVDRAEGSGAPRGAEPGAATPGYADLVEGQSDRPPGRFTPCDLVTRTQAQTILDTPLLEPIEAPMGPTCIYRSRSGKAFVTVVVQRMDFETVRPTLVGRERVTVAGRTAYCAGRGQPLLYVALPDERVLTVTAPCDVARRFAATALPRLSA